MQRRLTEALVKVGSCTQPPVVHKQFPISVNREHQLLAGGSLSFSGDQPLWQSSRWLLRSCYTCSLAASSNLAVHEGGVAKRS